MERLGRVHVGHDLVAQFNQIVGRLFGGDFREAQLRLGIDQARIDGHAGHIDDTRACGDMDGARVTNCSNLSALHDNRAVINRSVSNSQHLATPKNHRLVLSARPPHYHEDCQSERREEPPFRRTQKANGWSHYSPSL